MEYIIIFTALLLLYFLLKKLKKTKKRNLNIDKPRNDSDYGVSDCASDIEKLELKGPVKSIKDVYWMISLKEGKVVKGEPFDYTITKEFDENGNHIDTIIENNNPYYKNKNTKTFYDEKGNLIQEKRYEEDGKLLWKKSYSYDSKGKLSEWVNFNIESIALGKITFEYDMNYNKTLSRLYRYDETLFGILNYEYEKHGNCLNEYKEDTLCNPLVSVREIVYYENKQPN
jgi:hypothetical protein